METLYSQQWLVHDSPSAELWHALLSEQRLDSWAMCVALSLVVTISWLVCLVGWFVSF